MRLLPPGILVGLAVLTVVPALAATTKSVDVTRAGFTPRNVTVNYGDSVTWTNKDNTDHQVLADQVAFPTSPVLAPGQAYTLTFTKSGSFGYRDAFNTSRRGTVTVRPGLSIGATPATVTYGKAALLSGFVSNGVSGETVTLDAKDCLRPFYTRVGTMTSATGGAWAWAATKRSVSTVYQATWRNSKSVELTAAVAPAVSFKRVRRGRFTASVTAAQSFMGKHVLLQRYVRKKRSWKTLKAVLLAKARNSAAPTLVSATGVFRVSQPRGMRLRVVLPQDQAGACYAPGASRAVRA
ncbi:MAG TPA: cupredoxin domain-containing protein [Gaiellaceae bacterium]|jgi:plastocyanin